MPDKGAPRCDFGSGAGSFLRRVKHAQGVEGAGDRDEQKPVKCGRCPMAEPSIG